VFSLLEEPIELFFEQTDERNECTTLSHAKKVREEFVLLKAISSYAHLEQE
jgi:hypothetical protein